MDNKTLPLPDQRNYQLALEQAMKIAFKKLSKVDIEERCSNSGATLEPADGSKSIIVEYLEQPYRIILPELEVASTDPQVTIQPREKLLILHYIVNADGSPLSGNMLTYKEIPEGATYYPTFYKRAIKPLVDNFGDNPKRLLEVAAVMGGHESEYGDVSVTINAFGNVPLTFVLWRGDEEFPADGSILFDDNISGYLSAEDITVLCEIIAWKMVKAAKE